MSENHSATIVDMAGAVMNATAVKRSLDDDNGCLSAPAKKPRCDDEKHVPETTASQEVKMSQAEHLKALEGRFSLVKEALKTLVKCPESEHFTNAFKALQ
ncbi:hypothetical protein GJ744_012206 [Endocarpon pusillum]|uniref:Uncharacterized protein n=1 Tax=Endocarpon pusillum TaxID=364733 RepID=A0A8H7E1P2_9EURO|nr:hypothetical protein GJ744_012206 [Endocarpon pusillum]